MRGEPVDRIPFIARMDLWYRFHQSRGTLPHPYENAGLWDIQRDLGIGIFGFGMGAVPFYKLEYHGVDVETSNEGGTITTRYHTPYGTLTLRDRVSEELKDSVTTWARVEYPFKTPADYDALQYLIEHSEVVRNLDEYVLYVESIGPDGLAMPWTRHLPAHHLMIDYMGYEIFYLELHENEARVLRLVEALTEQHRRMIEVAVQTPAGAVEVGGNYDEEMTPPPIFDRFFAPFYREARQILESAGKILVIHGDGEMRTLLERIAECGIQVVEALTPKPMTSIDVAATRELWGDRVAMWGGIPSIILTEVFSEKEFERSLENLFHAVAPGDRFILGFGDNAPTDALFHRIRRVAEFWAENGRYPLGLPDVKASG
jgi:hypothetical protein